VKRISSRGAAKRWEKVCLKWCCIRLLWTTHWNNSRNQSYGNWTKVRADSRPSKSYSSFLFFHTKKGEILCCTPSNRGVALLASEVVTTKQAYESASGELKDIYQFLYWGDVLLFSCFFSQGFWGEWLITWGSRQRSSRLVNSLVSGIPFFFLVVRIWFHWL
jgi:hypothetical protein